MSTPSYGSGINRVPTREHDRHVRDALKRRVYFRWLVARGILQDPTGSWDVPHHKHLAQYGQGQVKIFLSPSPPSPAELDDSKNGKGKAEGPFLALSCEVVQVAVWMVARHPAYYVDNADGREWNDGFAAAAPSLLSV